ncbi:MAG: amidohydrolase family protein [Planctomycetota bacterium]|nr:amidohydrolase family protein [Planctomycetota bacterium]
MSASGAASRERRSPTSTRPASTGISKGVNDSGQAVTAEVRIGDVTNPDAISWYRQLASGVTTVNSLHGSANPIGGQNQVNKVRWGAIHPDHMHFEGAIAGIKFALGENVKQSNWGDDFVTRYPQTRMGVETLIRDRFLAARDYMKRGEKPRDLELEALAEILRGERLIHCHSYRQDEILMLCRVAAEFDFKIGTFQHVLEGYKVADAIKENAIGGSAFSDWWAYKVEVQDAIPYNGALMHAVGVVVSFNSDSDSLVRSLNVEAAKAVKYGGVPREEALKFVTLNPAKQLKVDDRVGSIEAGKHADLALWSGDPLSTYSRCVATWVDGEKLYSEQQDKEHRAFIHKERRRIIAKLLKRKKEKPEDAGEKSRRPVWWMQRVEHAKCGLCGMEER